MKAINTNVTGRDDWERERFDIITNNGLLPVEGIVRGFFGIHEGATSWTLTHLPTGVRLSFADDLLPLICLFAKIKGLVDWDFIETAEWLRRDRKAVSAAIAECGAGCTDGDRGGWDDKLNEVTAA